jgi:hypothetical protein
MNPPPCCPSGSSLEPQVTLARLSNSLVGLCCPVCHSIHVHPLEVVVEQGRTRTEVLRESTVTSPTDRAHHARGSLIGLLFACEAGHEFQYALEFHKGTTVVRLDAWHRDPAAPFQELWRN